METTKIDWQGSHCDQWFDHHHGGQAFIRLIPVWGSAEPDVGDELPRVGLIDGRQMGDPDAWQYAAPAAAIGPFEAKSVPLEGTVSSSQFPAAAEALAHACASADIWRFWKAPPDARRPGWVGNTWREEAPLYVRGANEPLGSATLWGFARKGDETVVLLSAFGGVSRDPEPERTRRACSWVFTMAEDFLAS